MKNLSFSFLVKPFSCFCSQFKIEKKLKMVGKIAFVVLCISITVPEVSAQQWSGSSNTNSQIGREGDVSIGTTLGGAKLRIDADNANGIIMERNTLEYDDTQARIGISKNNGAPGLRMDVSADNGSNFVKGIFIQENGFVGIGTTTPLAKLAVDGKIECEEIEVKNVGADYVFEEGYNLLELDKVEDFINLNKHLPGIAPASETEKGVELGAFSEKLLQKIEELTLYMIDLKRENDLLKERVLVLSTKIGD